VCGSLFIIFSVEASDDDTSQILNATKTNCNQSETTKAKCNQNEGMKTKFNQSEATKTKSIQSEATVPVFPAEASDDDCISIALSNTEIYEEANCEDVEIREEDTQESVIKIGVNDSAASAGVPILFPCQAKLKNNNITQEKTNEEHLLSLNNYCTAHVNQLSDNSSHLETSNLSFDLEDGHIQEVHGLTMESNGSASTNSYSQLNCSKSKLQKSLHNTVHSEGKITIMSELSISSTMKRMSNQNEYKDQSSAFKKRKRFSVAAGVVYEDEISSPESLKCFAMSQTLFSSNHSEKVKEVPFSSSCRGTSSSLSTIDPLLLSRVPPGATLVIYPGIFATKHMNKPCACVFCGEPSKMKNAVFVHSMQQQNERLHFVCDRCHQKLVHLEERPFSCNICKKSFISKDDFVSHSKVHKKEEFRKRVICNICKQVFTHVSTLRQHMISHSGEKSFSYEVAKDVSTPLKSRCSTKIQMLLDSNDSPEQAKEVPSSSLYGISRRHTSSSFSSHLDPLICSKLPPGAALVSDHSVFASMGMTTTTTFPCGFCHKTYTRKGALLRHIKKHHDENPLFSCEFCGKYFGDQYHLTRHLKTHSQRKPLFSCELCGEAFSCQDAVYRHIRQHQDENPLFSCEFCGKRFGDQYHLTRHLHTHSQKKPFKDMDKQPPGAPLTSDRGDSATTVMGQPFRCILCGVAFNRHRLSSQFCNLCHYKLTHPEKRPFSCSICNTSFKTTDDLVSHSKVHKEEEFRKNVICNICKKVFPHVSTLRLHMISHSG